MGIVNSEGDRYGANRLRESRQANRNECQHEKMRTTDAFHTGNF